MPQEITNNTPLTSQLEEQYRNRMKAAWGSLPEEQRKQLEPLLDQAHQQFADYLSDRKKAPDHRFHNILRMKSYLSDDKDGYLKRFDQQQKVEGIEVTVDGEGAILGTGQYEQLDLRWELVAGTVWLEHLLHQHPFPPRTPSTVQLGFSQQEKLRIAIAGDFGTGNFGANDSPSTKISKIIPKLLPHITIHLGDVYYAGTDGEEDSKLMRYWPPGSIGSFALNSNHEMYSGGGPYFNDAVGGPIFNKYQSPYSFFAIEYGDWLIVGLDSAYFSGVLDLYMDGSIVDPKARDNGTQFQFLRAMAQRNKKVILLTHHNGFDLGGAEGTTPPRLFSQVMSAFDGCKPPAYWYWGHKHAGAVYAALDSGILCRCTGHSALPWGQSTELAAGKVSGQVIWYENLSAQDPSSPLRVFNGFTALELDADGIHESFYDELGRITWSSDRGVLPRG